MKKIFFFSIFILLPLLNYAQWTVLNSETSKDIEDIWFKNEGLGFFIGGTSFGNSIERTTNGGQSWQEILQDSNTVWTQLLYADGDNLFVFGGNINQQSICAKSTDNGTTWQIDTISYTPRYPQFYNNNLYFISYSSGDSHALKKVSTNGTQSLLDDVVLFDINKEGVIYCLKENNQGFYISKSSDGGNTWNSSSSITATTGGGPTSSSKTNANLKSFHDTLLITFTYPNQVCYSYNAGNTWGTHQTNDIPGAYIPMYIISPKKLIGIQPANEIQKSNDGGVSFFSQGVMPEKINKFFFVNKNLGFLCGDNGMIYKTTNGGGLPTGIQEINPLKKKLKISPNPAKNTINLQYNNLQIQSLRLTDLSGRVVKAFPAESKTLNVSGVAAGLYFLQVKAKEGTVAKKVEIK